MGFTPREKQVIELHLLQGISFEETRKILNALESGVVTRERMRQIIVKLTRKALYYSEYFDKKEKEQECSHIS